MFGFVLVCFELTGTFEAHQPLGNWWPHCEIQGMYKKETAGFYDVSFCPSFLLSKRHIFSDFSGEGTGKGIERKRM